MNAANQSAGYNTLLLLLDYSYPNVFHMYVYPKKTSDTVSMRLSNSVDTLDLIVETECGSETERP